MINETRARRTDRKSYTRPNFGGVSKVGERPVGEPAQDHNMKTNYGVTAKVACMLL